MGITRRTVLACILPHLPIAARLRALRPASVADEKVRSNAAPGITTPKYDERGQQTGSNRAIDQPPHFTSRATIKGVDIAAPEANYNASAYGMTALRLRALKAAGFNTHRVFISLADFTSPPYGMENSVAKWIAYIQKSTDTGFNCIVSWNSTYEQRIEIVLNRDKCERFAKGLTALCTSLAKTFSPQQVALELMNEPPTPSDAAGWTAEVAPKLFSAVRTAAPDLTVIVQAESGGWITKIPEFNLKQFDANTVFAFHYYSPGEFTHQGIGFQPYLYGVPYPITRYAGGKSQMIADVAARIKASRVSDDQKASEIAHYTKLIDSLWYRNGEEWVDLVVLRSWIAAHEINPKRILNSEFGVVSNHNYNGSPGTDVSSRARYIAAIRKAGEAEGFAGWVVHQALGDFNLFEQATIYAHGDALIPELLIALGLSDSLDK